MEKADADGDPIVFLNVRSEQRDLLDLTSVADNLFKSRFETIPGVGRVDIWGDKEYAMRLWIDPDALAANNLTAIDVREAFARANVELPTGRIEGTTVDLNIRTSSRLGDDPDEFNNRVIKRVGDRLVRFRDIGYAEIGPLNERTILKRNSVPMVGVVLRPQSGANQIAIVDEFHRRLEDIKRDLPEDIELGIGFDTSSYIRESIAEVRQTLILALMLVAGTIFFFLRELRTTIIPIITIPVALAGTFFFLYVAGFSINVLTLLGLVLAIGLVVDDAIVVLENIYKRTERGVEPEEAGLEGVKEIFFAVIATTLALVAVFAPILFLGGLTGALFREFGVTLASAVVISSFVALTLTPMLSTRILKRRHEHPAFYRLTEPFFKALAENYRATLHWFLGSKLIAPAILIVCLIISVAIFRNLPRELAPLEDRGLLVLSVSGPQGTGYQYMLDAMDLVDAAVVNTVRDEEFEATLTVTSPGFGASSTVNSGFSRVVLSPSSKRDRSQMEIASSLSRALATLPEVDASVRQPSTINVGGGRGLPVQFVVRNNDIDKLRAIIPEFLAEARAHPVLGFVDVNLKFNQPELVLEINRDRADAIGVDVLTIADTVRASFSGQRFGYFLKNGEQYEIIGQFIDGGRASPDAIDRLVVRSASGALVPVSNLLDVREQSAAPVLYRYDRFTAATFSANIEDGFALGDGISAMQEVADGLLDETYTTSLSGQARELNEAGGSLAFVFIMALVLVYLVLAAQFESFRHPLTILLTVPLALTGGLLALWYFDQSLNIFSQIGLVMLIGLVTKNGILIVEFANQRRAAGSELREAIEYAAAARFRPVLMTTFSTILGTLPIALALGAGSQSRTPLGLAVIGGLLLGSMLTLYVIPAIYLALASNHPPRS